MASETPCPDYARDQKCRRGRPRRSATPRYAAAHTPRRRRGLSRDCSCARAGGGKWSERRRPLWAAIATRPRRDFPDTRESSTAHAARHKGSAPRVEVPRSDRSCRPGTRPRELERLRPEPRMRKGQRAKGAQRDFHETQLHSAPRKTNSRPWLRFLRSTGTGNSARRSAQP